MNNPSTAYNPDKGAPKVSIIVPNYNYARYLDTRMESILNQTFQDFEIIILDDCSTDGSAALIEKYRENPKVSLIEINSENSGSPFIQWKKGIGHARGKYIWIAEADDSALPDFLEKTVAAMESNPQASLAFTGSILIDDKGQPLGRDWDKWRRNRTHLGWKTFDGSKYIIHNLFWKNYIYNASMVLMRRASYSDTIIEESISMKNAGDWMFWVRMAEKGDVIEVYEKLNMFRRHSISATVSGDCSGKIRMEEIDVLKYIADKYPIGRYRRTMRLGQFIKTVLKSKQYSDETRKDILTTLNDKLSANMSTYRIERLNKAASAICPLLINRHRDRL